MLSGFLARGDYIPRMLNGFDIMGLVKLVSLISRIVQPKFRLRDSPVLAHGSMDFMSVHGPTSRVGIWSVDTLDRTCDV
jgi:hypothetical protein